ncbi:hypothetical protein ACFLS9_00620 [Bacteroidota bacterium]
MNSFKSLLLLVFPIFLFIASCCITDPEEKDPPKPPGYQEDIPWPSLADSPWPMNHHDPQSTGRSQYSGPLNGQILNEFNLLNDAISCGIMLDNDLNVYFTNGSSTDIGLKVIRNNTSPELLFNAGRSSYENFTTPLLRPDSTIIFTYDLRVIYAISLEGTIIWEFDFGESIIAGPATLSIDREGNIYLITQEFELYCISREGELNWIYEDERFDPARQFGFHMCVSPDGKYLYMPGKYESLLAFSINDLEIKWTYGDNLWGRYTVIDSYGRIYLFMERLFNIIKLVCMDKNGQDLWIFYIPWGPLFDNQPAIDKYGNIYIATDTLYSVNYSGLLNWKQPMEGFCGAPILIDGKSNVFVATKLHGTGGINIYSFSQHGKLNWKIHDDGRLGGSPALSNTGVLYYPIHSKRIITIY